MALACIPEIKGQRPKRCRKVALWPVKRPMIAPQPAQEHERVALAASFLAIKRPTSFDLGHRRTGIGVVRLLRSRPRGQIQ